MSEDKAQSLLVEGYDSQVDAKAHETKGQWKAAAAAWERSAVLLASAARETADPASRAMSEADANAARAKAEIAANRAEETSLTPKTVVTILREFLIEHEQEVESLGGTRPLEFIDVLRSLVNSNFSEEITRSALLRGGRMEELTRKFLEQVEKETVEKSSGSVSPLGDTHQMEKYGISFDGKSYVYGEYKYDKLTDAVNYAKLQKKRTL